jgi:hypothetical protein
MTETPDPVVARPMADVIALADHRPPHSARMASTDPLAVALAALHVSAGLATRTRALIEAGASDIFIDHYIAAWCDGARADVDANQNLHFAIADFLGALR